MKRYIFTLFALANIFPLNLHAQITAGSIPDNYTLVEDEMNLSVEIVEESDILNLDVNNDSVDDITFTLFRGAIEVDGSSYFELLPLHDNIRFCNLELTSYVSKISLYAEGSTLACNNPSNFDFSDSAFFNYIGGLGEWPFDIPVTADNHFIYYKWDDGTTEFDGWIEVSFNVHGNPASWATIHSWISLDFTSSIQDLEVENSVQFYPNPVEEGLLFFDSKEPVENYSIYNLQGQLLRHGILSSNAINVGGLKGMNVVQLHTTTGFITEVIQID